MTRKVRFFVTACLLLLAACSSLPPRPPLAEAFALPPASDGELARRTTAGEAQHAGQSGFRLVSNGTEAYAARMYSAQVAAHSLDIQTYIWHADMTGKMLAQRALAAADRGVQVRILIDDLDARAKNAGFAALDAHPNIEVRLFNPFASRSGGLRRLGEFGTGFRRLNHRMHNKSWIVDNRVALVGGRNLGNEYFGADENGNFVDLDVLMVGPVVREVSATFDRFWNATSNYPIALVNAGPATPEALARLRVLLDAVPAELAASHYAEVLREDPDVQRLLANEGSLHWSERWSFASDDPLKLENSGAPAQRSLVLATLLPAMQAARQTLNVISPYFVPGRAGTDFLVARAGDGIGVRILTNSLAATDVAAVHGGYARYRDDLLAGGVRLWELKPDSGMAPSKFSLRGSSGSSLHTKAMVIDDSHVFIGSYNLDPRSTAINTEQGVLIANPDLARELTLIFDEHLAGDHAWQVQQMDGRLRWSDGQASWTRDPQARASRRLQAWLASWLPLQSQL